VAKHDIEGNLGSCEADGNWMVSYAYTPIPTSHSEVRYLLTKEARVEVGLV
jgi:hypothetical protein